MKVSSTITRQRFNHVDATILKTSSITMNQSSPLILNIVHNDLMHPQIIKRK